MIGLDAYVIGLFQRFYEHLLDRFDARIGTFRMGLALTPIAAEASAYVIRGDVPIAALIDCVFALGVVCFYTFRMMMSDDRLQSRGRLAPINKRSIDFRSRSTMLRIFYLAFFTSSLLFHHNVGGLGMLAIVYARCVVVRARSNRTKSRRFAYQAN